MTKPATVSCSKGTVAMAHPAWLPTPLLAPAALQRDRVQAELDRLPGQPHLQLLTPTPPTPNNSH
jgi:hypothetical protein